jgi:hypothetical protein
VSGFWSAIARGNGVRGCLWSLVLLAACHVSAAEKHFDFSQTKLGQLPPGFRSTISGNGTPGSWKVIEDKTSAASDIAVPESTVTVRHQALAQLDRDPTDEHFPLLVYDDLTLTDFTLTTRFKTVAGDVEQMAGIAFRIQDEKNYYVVRASSLGNSFRFYKVVGGVRTLPIGPQTNVIRGVWHDLKVECVGHKIRCFLDNQQVIPDITDTTFAEGKVGFWTKSDSVSYFGDTKIVYTPKEMLAEVLVQSAMKAHGRLIGLQIWAGTSDRSELHLVAGSNPSEIGRAAGSVEQDVVARGIIYAGREGKAYSVTMPLRDRNGDPIAAVRVIMEARSGQTADNAAVRARPIVMEMEKRVRSAKDLTR